MNYLTERKKWLPMCMMLIAAISLSACSDDDDDDDKKASDLALTSTVDELAITEKHTFTATESHSGDITWGVTNTDGTDTDLASIDSATGELTALKVGTVKVVATVAGDDTYKRGTASHDVMLTGAVFEITVRNLTAGQPFSPPIAIMHGAQWQAFETGTAASVPLEKLSEAGDSSDLATAVGSEPNAYGHTSGTGVLAPGGDHNGTQKLEIQVHTDRVAGLRVSVLTMLVNTNDAIAAVNGGDISDLAVGESRTWMANTYDTGTEANTETAATIPGPASTVQNKEGFNAARDDIRDEVHLHAGVVTSDDGLSTSALKYLHRWDNPAMQVIVKRMQ